MTLNRPERHNAYGRELRDALVAALDLALLDDTLTEVVLSGNGPSFCSGGDLGEFGVSRDLDTAHLIRTRAGAALPLHKLATASPSASTATASAPGSSCQPSPPGSSPTREPSSACPSWAWA